ncbi:hypothetical protein KDW36_16310 [Burkholderia dolosa]|uniref:hypothetical protein n=1 Tax=Burkholderia dolosa TaxID=152500 RepID=UPI001B9D9E8F|nr:hypothetical protein [Burkholderia dolosa]MBR8314749.1 hypothetical protein [Burkholderia dolosa]
MPHRLRPTLFALLHFRQTKLHDEIRHTVRPSRKPAGIPYRRADSPESSSEIDSPIRFHPTHVVFYSDNAAANRAAPTDRSYLDGSRAAALLDLVNRFIPLHRFNPPAFKSGRIMRHVIG